MSETQVRAQHWIIYVIRCTAPGADFGKQYVGQCKADRAGSSAKRWRNHRKDARRGLRSPIQIAIRRHGDGAFIIDDVACCRSIADALSVETTMIQSLDTLHPRGFNMQGSPTHLAQLSAMAAARALTPEGREHLARISSRGPAAWMSDPVKVNANRVQLRAMQKDATIQAGRIEAVRAVLAARNRRGKRFTIHDDRQLDLVSLAEARTAWLAALPELHALVRNSGRPWPANDLHIQSNCTARRS